MSCVCLPFFFYFPTCAWIKGVIWFCHRHFSNLTPGLYVSNMTFFIYKKQNSSHLPTASVQTHQLVQTELSIPSISSPSGQRSQAKLLVTTPCNFLVPFERTPMDYWLVRSPPVFAMQSPDICHFHCCLLRFLPPSLPPSLPCSPVTRNEGFLFWRKTRSLRCLHTSIKSQLFLNSPKQTLAGLTD